MPAAEDKQEKENSFRVKLIYVMSPASFVARYYLFDEMIQSGRYMNDDKNKITIANVLCTLANVSASALFWLIGRLTSKKNRGCDRKPLA